MNEHTSNGIADLTCRPLCLACSQETRILYVHLCSGTVLKIANANGVRLTDDEVIIPCGHGGDGHAVVLKRSDVYFTSCEKASPPPL